MQFKLQIISMHTNWLNVHKTLLIKLKIELVRLIYLTFNYFPQIVV
jgi:hypothetical protein